MKHSRRLMAGIVFLVGALVLGSPQAAASTSARADSSSAKAASASWGVAPAAAGATPTLTPFTLSWSYLWFDTDHVQVFDLVNVGTTETTAQSLDVTTVRTSGSLYTLTLSLTACVDGTWKGNSCTGRSVPLGSSDSGTIKSTAAFPIAPGERISIRAVGSSRLGTYHTTTVNVSVARSQVRPSATTHR